jgi:hypothetical protein
VAQDQGAGEPAGENRAAAGVLEERVQGAGGVSRLILRGGQAEPLSGFIPAQLSVQ